MKGMNSKNGLAISDIEHLRQSIYDILITPLGSRVLRRDYGSRLFELIDMPFNEATKVELYAATAEALVKWEPRVELNRVWVSRAESYQGGQVMIGLECEYLLEGRKITLEGLVI